MPGDRGLIQDVRPSSAEITGQQRELFAFDAFEYEDPNKNDPAKITVKEGWKLNLQRAVIGDTDLSVDGSFLNVDLIEAGSITANEIDVTDLFAQDITATGTITGGTITGATIIGGTLEGGTISIGGTPGSPNFFVDSNGNMEAAQGTFGGAVNLGTADFTTTGNINVTNITASNSISTSGNLTVGGIVVFPITSGTTVLTKVSDDSTNVRTHAPQLGPPTFGEIYSQIVPFTGSVNIYAEHQVVLQAGASGPLSVSEMRFLKNGTQIAIWTNGTSTFIARNFTTNVDAGDVISIEHRTFEAGNNTVVRNKRLRANITNNFPVIVWGL